MAKDHKNEGSAASVIYVVDDEPMLLSMAEMVLQAAGFEVKIFQDPRHALANYAATNPPPALVITDFAMGADINGLDVIRECRKLHPRQKIILASGTVDESVYAKSDATPNLFLPKPFNSDHFVRVVRALIGN